MKDTPVSLGSYTHAAFSCKLKRGRRRAVLTYPCPLGVRLRLFGSGVDAPGGPAHGDSPLGFRSPLLSQLVPREAISLHFGGSRNRPADLHKPEPKTSAYHMLRGVE
jgi:hypothetical protein